jgi:hypothetical protein
VQEAPETDRREVEQQRAELRSARTQLDAALRDLKQQRAAQESDAAKMQVDRDQIRKLSDTLEQERRELAKQIAEAADAGKAAELIRAECEAERARLAELRDSLEKEQKERHVRPSAANAEEIGVQATERLNEFGEHLLQMQQERRQLQIERTRMAEEFQRLRACQPGTAAHAPRGDRARTGSSRWPRGAVLRLLVNPGRAGADELVELFDEVGRLDRRLRGRGLDFRIGECRSRTAAGRADSAQAAGDSAVVEVFLVREGGPDTSDPSGDLPLWEQLRSALSMALPLGSGLADLFPMGDPVGPDFAVRRIVADALDRSQKSRSRQLRNEPQGDSGATLLDGVSQQIRQLQGVLQSLSRQSGFSIELTVASESDQGGGDSRDLAESGSGRWRRLGWKIALAATILAGAAGAAWWWTTLAGWLGIDAL